ncbi:MAG TPA: hypothetical protein PKA20_02710 [Burkholderiaceae bacterium]|nr:hypothetical protein [Burkholderiaceae bacterium]
MKAAVQPLGQGAGAETGMWSAMNLLSQRLCAALNDRRFADFLEFCGRDFRYRASAFSPELRRKMVWLEAGRTDLENLYELLPRQVSSAGSLCRFVNVVDVRAGDASGTVAVTSSLAAYFTNVDGATSLFAIGHYDDVFAQMPENPLLIRRELRLQTRMLDSGTLEVL